VFENVGIQFNVADHAHAVMLWCSKHLRDFAYGRKVFSPLSHAVSHVAITAMMGNHTLENR